MKKVPAALSAVWHAPTGSASALHHFAHAQNAPSGFWPHANPTIKTRPLKPKVKSVASVFPGQHRAFTVAMSLQIQGFAVPQSSPVRTIYGYSTRKFLALRLAVAPLNPPLVTWLSCRHGDGRSDETI